MKEKYSFAVTFFLCALLFSSFAEVGCRKSEEADTGGGTVHRNSADSIPSEAEAEAFARSLEKSLENGDSLNFVRSIDWSSLTDRVLTGIPEHQGKERFDRRFLIQLFSKDGGIAQSVADKVKNGGSYKFLRVRKIDRETIAVTFRLVDADGGLDYHDLYLRQEGENLILIREFYLYHFDELFSETLRRTLVPDLYADGKNDYGMLMSDLILILYKENQLLIQEFSKAFEEKNTARALDLFDQLPNELKNLKTFQLWRLKAAQGHPDSHVYSFVLAEIRQKYHQEGWIDFLSLDYFFNRREFHEALACVDRMDQLVGGDPYLENFRCWAYLNLAKIAETKNDQESSRKYLEAAQQHFEAALQKEAGLAEDQSFKSLKIRLQKAKEQNVPKSQPEPAQTQNPFDRVLQTE